MRTSRTILRVAIPTALSAAVALAAVSLWGPLRRAHADTTTPSSAAKIGYVDLQGAVAETDDGQAAQTQLKSLFDEKQKQLDDAQTAFKAAQDDLDKQRSVLKPDAIAAKEDDLQKQYVDLQSTYMELQKEISDKEQELTKPIIDKMGTLVGQIAQDEGFTMIVDKQIVLWAPDDTVDITKELVRRYNAAK
jgi:outer membrane protein